MARWSRSVPWPITGRRVTPPNEVSVRRGTVFGIYQLESKDPLLGSRYVGDPERTIRLQRVAGLANRPGGAFKLTVGEAVIPFEVTGDQLTDPESGKCTYSAALTALELALPPNSSGKLTHTNFLMRRQD